MLRRKSGAAGKRTRGPRRCRCCDTESSGTDSAAYALRTCDDYLPKKSLKSPGLGLPWPSTAGNCREVDHPLVGTRAMTSNSARLQSVAVTEVGGSPCASHPLCSGCRPQETAMIRWATVRVFCSHSPRTTVFARRGADDTTCRRNGSRSRGRPRGQAAPSPTADLLSSPSSPGSRRS